uniref:Uncharacterized protein n=3 Tax=unclassified Caudoviricetes TaxID=2788787 RepID=A0A8S5NHC5_9CAUD|nr:MAG TPA: hypothetical protein [Siphoviridae sp. ctUF252]DAE01540.1 MAG TPA: hypothetical protein [Siphoviridae sp. ctZHt25]DAE03805.1 MAG TPA: hypothetical protein [Myoviridae sp. ct2Pw37]
MNLYSLFHNTIITRFFYKKRAKKGQFIFLNIFLHY